MPGTSGVTLYRAPCPSANLAGVTGLQQVLNQQGGPLVLPLPTNGILDSVPFYLRIAGHFNSTVAGSRVTNVLVYLGTSPTIASNVQITSTANHTLSNTNPHVVFRVDLYVTGITKQLAGTTIGYGGNGTIALVFAGGPTAIFDPNQDANNQSSPLQGFTLGWNATSSSTGETATIDVFELRI